jgi:hypothetical protein
MNPGGALLHGEGGGGGHIVPARCIYLLSLWIIVFKQYIVVDGYFWLFWKRIGQIAVKLAELFIFLFWQPIFEKNWILFQTFIIWSILNLLSSVFFCKHLSSYGTFRLYNKNWGSGAKIFFSWLMTFFWGGQGAWPPTKKFYFLHQNLVHTE